MTPQPTARDAAAVAAAHQADADAVHGDVTVDDLHLEDELAGSDGTATPEVAEYALRLGDDALILSQRLSWWISRAPELEEDMALGNIALDLLGHARSLLHYAGTATGKTEDDLAYWRDEHEFRSAWLFEQPNGDFAHTIVRGFIASTYMLELYSALSDSPDEPLKAIAQKAVKEVSYHRDHAVQWMLRLAGGTDVSRARLLVALADTWPYTEELFRDDDLTAALAGVVPAPSSLRAPFDEIVTAVLAECEIDVSEFVNKKIGQSSGGGRGGNHSTHLGPLLAEMQVLARRHPGAKW